MHLSDFHKFYLTAIDAKTNYFSKKKKKDTKSYSIAESVTDINSFKVETIDENSLHVDDGNEENLPQSLVQENFAPETIIDKCDFADAFCEVLAADKNSSLTRNISEASINSREDSDATIAPTPPANPAESIDPVPFVDKFQKVASKKRSANYSETSLICEYCGIMLHSSAEANIHYTTEHSISSEKRVRTVE